MKRAVGVVTDGRSLGDHDHVCWIFDDRAAFVERALEFLADGLRLGLRIAYVGSRPAADLAGELSPLGDVAGLVAGERLAIASLPEMYPSGSVIDPGHQVEMYRRATREAVAAGFDGLRVAADATQMVMTPAQRDAFTRYEHRIDRMMAVEPFSALCGYDAHVLGADGMAELACLHPLEGGHRSPFHLFALDAGRLALAGEFDLAGHELFRWALGRTERRPPDLHIELGEVAFIDHRSLLTLDEWAQATGGDIILEQARPMVRRMASTLGLTRLHLPEPA